MTVDVTTLFSKAARNGPPTPGGKPMQHADRPIAYNFDSGLAAEETFPIDDFARIGAEVIAHDGAEAFEYGNSDYNELVYGYPELRDQIAARIQARDGRDLGREGILLTSGSVQAIALAIRAFVGPGDGVVVEAPSFPYACATWRRRAAPSSVFPSMTTAWWWRTSSPASTGSKGTESAPKWCTPSRPSSSPRARACPSNGVGN